MRTITLVRASAVAAVAGVVTTLALVPGADAATIAAPTGSDPAAAAVGASYLAAQPSADHIIKTYYVFPPNTPPQSYEDYGLTIDAATALDAVGGHTADVAAMTTALEANIASYAFGGGSDAKLASFLLAQGRTGTDINSLVADLDTHISTTAPTAGRLVDTTDDFESPLTQAYAVGALNNANDPLASSALTFLLAQQCTAGFFRDSFSDKLAADQTCNGAASPTPSVDTTGLALIQLQDQKTKPVVSAAITKALDWLQTQQSADGSFNSGNANSTGLAGWALGLGGRTAAATKAAGWIRAHQLANAGSCVTYNTADNGAVMVDDLGLANAGSAPLSLVDNSSATRATTQALPALLWADGGATSGATTVTGPTDFVPAGTTQTVSIKGSPGNTICVTSAGTNTRVVLPASGTASAHVAVPASTADTQVTVVDAGGESHALTIEGLAKQQLKLKLKPKQRVHRGDKEVVKVKGLADGESAKVTFGGEVVDKGQANERGVFTARFTVSGALGQSKVKAVGAFADRKGSARIQVVR